MCNWKNGINLIKLAESFFLKYSYRALQRSQLALYEKGFERLASLASLVHYQPQYTDHACLQLVEIVTVHEQLVHEVLCHMMKHLSFPGIFISETQTF